uniref:Uncharacterized protein n=1 Tax=Tetradesmus obliquus TaxID=3088 RepID=A0A383VAC1_TETOB|eukprot:jgi/Sobl393_1/18747/SZX62518.1
MPAYSHLLQESLILQPSLLMQPPQQAAASVVVLERCLRLSAVWLGPDAVSQLLANYSPASLASHLSDLLGVWLGAGQVPHSFGQLWLEAPAALLDWDGPSFERHLAALQQQLPEMPIGRLLASSSSLAGMLLSLHDVSNLDGCVLKHGGFLFIAPDFCNISVKEEVDAVEGVGASDLGSSGHCTLVYHVYGCAREDEDAAQLASQTDGSKCGQPVLLMRLDARSPSDVGLMPVAILPPRQLACDA